MHYIGIDIIEISRIRKVIAEQGDAFLERVYTVEETQRYKEKIPSLAARFAAKEAIIKALGTTDKGISLSEISILADESGRPEVILRGKALKQAKTMGINKIAVSLSHSKNYAIASAMGQSED